MTRMVGSSILLTALKESIAIAARTDASVLIHGETGTGKELVARAIHLGSPRSVGPLVALNCAGLCESLLESQLFGHERGAFTGAFSRTRGKFELASGGTLFLDEVAELSSSSQAKLLRAIQENEIDRIGGSNPIPIDVRFISATNRDLGGAVTDGEFREDLYYRLNVILIQTPALRQRREDIPALARCFIAEYAKKSGRSVHDISSETESILCQYDWPGNVRQLQNVILHAIAYARSEVVRPEDLPVLSDSAVKLPEPQTYAEAIEQARVRVLKNALALTNGKYKEASLLLNLNPKSMHGLLKRLNLSHLLRQ